MTGSITNPDRLLGVEVRHLAALEAIVDTGSFRAAARELGYSQSAISQQVATLERAAGVRLLERPVGTRTVTLTEAGERLLRHARRITGAMRSAEADLAALARGDVGTLRVGTFQSASVRLLPRVMRDFVDRRPGIDVQLIEADYEDELLARLLRGTLDVTFLLRTDDPRLEAVPVLVDPYVLLVPRDSPLAERRRPVPLREISELPLVGYRRPEGGEAVLRSAGAEPKVVFRSDESAVVQGLVAAGLGHALVPRLTVDQRDRTVRAVEVDGIGAREITLAWHADRTLSPGALAFRDVVVELAPRLA